MTSATSSQLAAFAAAEARWEQLITGDLPDVPLNVTGGGCHEAVDELIDDLLIFVDVSPIDGPGGAIGSAGPCYIRSLTNLPITGTLTLDSDDLSQAENFGILEELILHEMGHVIGFGTLWNTFGLLTGGGTSDPYFTGTRANDEFDQVGGAGYPGNAVPVENTGGPGTADGHWRESVFDSELMTGWLTVGANPLSSVSVGAMGDEGYVVDLSAADGFTLSLALRVGPPHTIWVGDDVRRMPTFRVDPSGRVLRLER